MYFSYFCDIINQIMTSSMIVISHPSPLSKLLTTPSHFYG